MRQRFVQLATAAACIMLAAVGAAAQTTPGETSAAPLAQLHVAEFDRATGRMRLSYQTGCDTSDNNIYIGALDQVSALGWSDQVCSIGTSGSHAGFDPGPGSYFFVIVGNDGRAEGSYGRTAIEGAALERPAQAGNACGEIQDLANTCSPSTEGDPCASSADCGSRQACVADATGGAQCACLDPFGGDFCQTCAPGYAGVDCRDCAPGFVSNAMQNADGGDVPVDLRAPELFACVPDVPGDCGGRDCSGRGTCVVAGLDAICACDTGYTGRDCDQCAPNYEQDAAGGCSLGLACAEAKCGGHGDCVATPFGDVTCDCDAGYHGADCGGPELQIATSSETLTLYDGERVVLEPRGGVEPYAWRLIEGPARLVDCAPRDEDPGCPTGGTALTIVAATGGLPDLLLVKVGVTDGTGLQTAINLAALPSSLLPFTGPIRTELLPYYRAMLKYMRARGIRGGVLGISKGGTIVATNGYGYRDAGLDADPFVNAGEAGPLVQPHAPFRIASVTKPLTAAAVRDAAADAGVDITSSGAFHQAARWVQQSLGFSLINGAPPFNYNVPVPLTTDNRWSGVTIQHLLNHHVGFWRDSALPALNGRPAYNAGKLPFTVDPDDPNDFQTALTGTSSDISYATMYAVAALRLTADPRPTVENTILFAAGNVFDYPPGGNQAAGDNYANIGYQLAGRVLEGLRGQPYDPDDATVPMGWGRFPSLLQNYLCEASGVQSGIFPGDAFNPRPGEPYYRHIDGNGNEEREWNLAEGGDKIRYDNAQQVWEFCQSGCPDGPGASWDLTANTPEAYGGIWLAQRNSAGGIVATTSALLRFARNHRVKVGQPNEDATGTGSVLPAPAGYGSGSSHNGSLPGTRSWLWQLGGSRTNNVPLDVAAWDPDPASPLDLDDQGQVLINEATLGLSNCTLPSDVALAVIFNQRQDRRAPESGSSGASNSTSGRVYGRIIDYLGDATCQVDAQGWPQIAEPPAQLGVLPSCD